MLVGADLPESIVLELDRCVQNLRAQRPKEPEWPFSGSVIVQRLSVVDKQKLLDYEAELAAYNKYKEDGVRAKFSRSAVFAQLLAKAIARLEKK